MGTPKACINDIKTECDLQRELMRINGANLIKLTGLGANTILLIMVEVGTDLEKFYSAKHFASYLVITPNNKITGVSSYRQRPTA